MFLQIILWSIMITASQNPTQMLNLETDNLWLNVSWLSLLNFRRLFNLWPNRRTHLIKLVLTFDTSWASSKESPTESSRCTRILFFLHKLLDLFLIPDLGHLWLFLQINFVRNQNGNKSDQYSENPNDTRDTTLSLLKVQNWVRNRCLRNVVPQVRNRSW